jgi:hypothetical protein
MLMVLRSIVIGTLMVTTVQIMVIFMPTPLLEEPQLTKLAVCAVVVYPHPPRLHRHQHLLYVQTQDID